ncbi:MAG: hypothetical protein ACLF0G_12460 [Candidatus Brocadiia bacterium]
MKTLPSRRTIALAGVLLAAFVLATAPARGGEPMVVLRASFRNVPTIAGKLGKFVDKVMPGMGMMVQQGANQLMQGPEMAGVDWTKPISIVLFGGKAFGQKEPVPTLVVQLADTAAFRAAREKAPGGPKQFDVRGNVAVLADKAEALQAVTPLRQRRYTELPTIAEGGDIYFTFYIADTLKEYQAEIGEGLAELERNAGQAPGPGAFIQKFTKAVRPLLTLAGQQATRVTLVLGLADEAFELSGRFYAAEGTELGGFFAAQPGGTTDIARYLPEGLAASCTMQVDISKLRPLAEAAAAAVAPALELDAEGQRRIVDLLFASTQTGEAAIGMAGDAQHKGVQTVQVARIADPAKYRAATREAMEWLMGSAFAQFFQGAGVAMKADYQANARQYKGVEVDRVTMTFGPAEDAGPDVEMPPMPPQVTEIAALGTLAVSSSNNEKGDLLNAAIDRIQADGGNVPPELLRVGDAAPQKASLLFALSFNTAMAKAVEQAAEQAPGAGVVIKNVFQPNPDEPPITGHVDFQKDELNFAVHIPHQPIVTMAQRFQQMMQQGQQPGGGPPGGQKPPDDDF